MFPRWSLRGRMLYQLWFGGWLTFVSLVMFFTVSHVAIVGVLFGVLVLIGGLITRARIMRQELKQPGRSLD
jgi:hypothetical protein